MKRSNMGGKAGVIILVVLALASTAITYGAVARFRMPEFSMGNVFGHNFGYGNHFLNSNGVPRGSKLVLNINYKVNNDEDSGNVGYWALDNYDKSVMVWQEPNSTYYVVARYVGTWQTFAGAMSPGSGVTETANARGSMYGGYEGTFTATSVTCKNGYLGTYNFGGTQSDILLGKYGNGQKGDASTFSYLSNCFTGATGFNYVNWGWTYKYRNQAWNNLQSGTTGDIVA